MSHKNKPCCEGCMQNHQELVKIFMIMYSSSRSRGWGSHGHMLCKISHKNSPVKGWGGLSKNVQNVQNWIILIRSRSFFSNFPCTHPLTHPSTHTSAHKWGVSTNHKSSTRTELSWLGQDLFDFYWFNMTTPIDPPIHPTTNRWGSLHKL